MVTRADCDLEAVEKTLKADRGRFGGTILDARMWISREKCNSKAEKC